MIVDALGSALKGLELDLGLSGRVSGEPAPYVAMAHLKFDSVTAFQESFGPHGETFAADIKNYSNVQSELQISEIINL